MTKYLGIQLNITAKGGSGVRSFLYRAGDYLLLKKKVAQTFQEYVPLLDLKNMESVVVAGTNIASKFHKSANDGTELN